MSDLVQRLRLEHDFGVEGGPSVCLEAATRIRRLENALLSANKLLAEHARATGPMHSWWDIIFDNRKLLKE